MTPTDKLDDLGQGSRYHSVPDGASMKKASHPDLLIQEVLFVISLKVEINSQMVTY